MFRNVQKAVLVSLALGLIAGAPIRLAAQDRDSSGVMAGVVEVVNDVKLGIQVSVGIRQSNLAAIPLENRTVLNLKRPMDGRLSYKVPYGEVGLALRFRGAEVASSFQLGGGNVAGTRHWSRFRDGTNAIPFEPTTIRGKIRAEYLAFDWIGVGASLRQAGTGLSGRCSDCDFRVDGVTEALFEANSQQTTFSLYVPVQKEWGRIQFTGRIGASIYSRSQTEAYRLRLDFARDQSTNQSEAPARSWAVSTFGVESNESPKPEVYRQFGRAGIAVPLGAVTVRALVGVERLSVPTLTTRWSYEARLEIGLPF